MVLDINVSTDVVKECLRRLTNQTYKVLPYREEGVDWIKPLNTVIKELDGMMGLIEFYEQTIVFSLMCKLNSLKGLESENDYPEFRRTVFECLNLFGKLVDSCH